MEAFYKKNKSEQMMPGAGREIGEMEDRLSATLDAQKDFSVTEGAAKKAKTSEENCREELGQDLVSEMLSRRQSGGEDRQYQIDGWEGKRKAP